MSKDKKRNPRPVIDNRQARYNFELLESFEAVLALEGWEVKGIRSGEVDMKDSYVLMKDGEAWILGLKISPPKEVTFQVDQNRTKKLLLTKSELGKIFAMFFVWDGLIKPSLSACLLYTSPSPRDS